MRPLLRASTKAIACLYNNCLSANVSSDPIPKTVDHVIPKVGGAHIRTRRFNFRSNNVHVHVSGALKWSYYQNFFFAYLVGLTLLLK